LRLSTQKTKGHVMLPLPAEVKAALDLLPFPMHEDGSQTDSGYFFWSGSGKKSSARGTAERMLAPVFRRAKILGAHTHRFRHTLATDILAKGGTMAHVAEVLGISEHIARRHYAKWSAARQERIATIMRAVQGGKSRVGEVPQQQKEQPPLLQ
jgi:integrase